MSERLKIRLYEGWRPVENKGGPATYVCGDSCLQFSQIQHTKGPLPIDLEGLVEMYEKFTRKIRGRRDLVSGSGKCELGIFGTVVAKGDSPAYVQVWMLSNKIDFILITHISDIEPTPQEITQARSIAEMTTLGPQRVQ